MFLRLYVSYAHIVKEANNIELMLFTVRANLVC